MSREEVDLDRVIQGTLFGEGMINAAVAALLAANNGDYIAVNDAACQLTGYARTQLMSLRMGALGADEESRRIYADIALGHRLRGRKRIKRRDDRVVSCRYWAIDTVVGQLPYFILLLWPESRSRALAAST